MTNNIQLNKVEKTEGLVLINFLCPFDLRNKLRTTAVNNKCSMSSIIIDGLRNVIVEDIPSVELQQVIHEETKESVL